MHGPGTMFNKILEFEQLLAKFTGAPYAIMTDCCTHAIELCLRYHKIQQCEFTAYTYLSIPMTMHKLGIEYQLLEESWIGEYPFKQTPIWDSARRLEPNMYRTDSMQCLSFGHDKPLNIGRGGAILLDDSAAYQKIVKMRYDGRDLSISPWQSQGEFELGFHYKPTPEEAIKGIWLLDNFKTQSPKQIQYPDLRKIKIKN
jgi:dTDP-4-amino-4,6-dideoxygalactose transaminase